MVQRLLPILALAFANVALPCAAQEAGLPNEPFLRIETGIHTGRLSGMDVDSDCRLLVTGG